MLDNDAANTTITAPFAAQLTTKMDAKSNSMKSNQKEKQLNKSKRNPVNLSKPVMKLTTVTLLTANICSDYMQMAGIFVPLIVEKIRTSIGLRSELLKQISVYLDHMDILNKEII